jgi:hypothetical protein
MHLTLGQTKQSCSTGTEAAARAAGTSQKMLRSTLMPCLDDDWDGASDTLAATQPRRLWRYLTDRHQPSLCSVGWGAGVCALLRPTQDGRP